MGWLGTWAYRRKITVESDRVDVEFTGVIPIVLSSTAGIGTTNVSGIFTEVGASYKKIAVTTSDGTTELEVEVERWDSISEVARLFIRSTYSSDTDTEFYIYYDSLQGDNANVKDPGSATALYPTASDEDWECVYHLAEAAGNFKDSCGLHDAATYSVTTRQAAGLEGGYSVLFDKSVPDYIRTGITTALRNQNDMTVIVVGYLITDIATAAFIGLWPATDVWFVGTGYSDPNDRIRVLCYDSAGTLDQVAQAYGTRTGQWWRIVAQRGRNDELQLWLNGSSIGTDATADLVIRADSTTEVSIGAVDSAADGNFNDMPVDGYIDEVWVCNTKLSDAYIKALMSGFNDDLINWSTEEALGAAVGWVIENIDLDGAVTFENIAVGTIAAIDNLEGTAGGEEPPPPPPEELDVDDFDTSREGGNGENITKNAQNDFDIDAEYDFATSERYWFLWEITGNAGGQTVYFTVDIWHTIGSRTGDTPVYSFDDGATWSYVAQGDITYENDGDTNTYARVIFPVVFPPGQHTGIIAVTMPFFYSDLSAYAVAFSSAYGYVDSYLSEGSRDIYVFYIDNGNPAGKDTVWVIAGQEPSETWSQIEAMGMLEYLISGDATAATLRAEHNWVIIPMINPDGDYLGKTQRNGNDVDLTLQWDDARSSTAEAEIQGCMDAMHAWETAGHTIDAFIDLHSRYVDKWMILYSSYGDQTDLAELHGLIRAGTYFGEDGNAYPGYASNTTGKSWKEIAQEFGCASVLLECNQFRSNLQYWQTASIANIKLQGENLARALEGYRQ